MLVPLLLALLPLGDAPQAPPPRPAAEVAVEA